MVKSPYKLNGLVYVDAILNNGQAIFSFRVTRISNGFSVIPTEETLEMFTYGECTLPAQDIYNAVSSGNLTI